MTTHHATRTLTTRLGDRVTYDVHGEPRAGAAGVVFVAGAGPYRASDPATTACAAALAARGVAAVVHDRLGRGDSPVQGSVGLDREVAAVEALVGVAGGRAVLCGHSSGGAIALYAAIHGVQVAGLALWEAPLDPATPGVAAWTRRTEELLDAGDREGALENFLRDMPPELVGGLRDSPVWPAWVAHAPALRVDAQALRWAFSAPYDERFGAELGRRGVPLRAVVGSETFPEMPRAAEALAAAVPGARSVTVAGAWHTWEPEAMAAELSDLCAQVDAEGSAGSAG